MSRTMDEMDYVLEDLAKKKTLKENIGKWVAVVGTDYAISDSFALAYSKIRKMRPGEEPFVFKIVDQSVVSIPG